MSGRRRKAVRVAVGAAAATALVSIQGCIFFFPQNAVRSMSGLKNLERQLTQAPNSNLPEIDVILNAAGGDAVSVFLEGSASARFRIAEAAAEWLGAVGAPASADAYDPDVATVQLDRRLVTRSGDAWTLTLETSTMQSAVENEGFEGFDLFVCHPAVETRIDASRRPDYPGDVDVCYRGYGWAVVGEPLRASVRMLPDTADYLRYLAGVVLGVVLLSALAWFIGDRLRRGPFRRRSPAPVAIGLLAGSMVAVVGFGAAVGVGAGAGPADNLALAKDLGVGPLAAAVGLPGLAGVIPGVIFAILLVRKRPWADEPPAEEWRPWPVPPPPGPPGAEPPPPLPWSR